MIEIVTVGWLTTDDIVLPDGTYRRSVPGGGALYSAVGAYIWNRNVGIHSVTGDERLQAFRQQVESYGIDSSGINGIPGCGLELWLLHETGTDKQQVPKIRSATALEMDRGREVLPWHYRTARGYHIAPQTPHGSFENVERLAAKGEAVISLDLLVDAYVEAALYGDLTFLDGLSAFLPSREEVRTLWAPDDLGEWIHTLASTRNCIVAVKMGDEGSLVCEARGTTVIHVPTYPADVVDTTGAGDGYCGGFIAGLVDGRPAVECAVMGTVSASFIVEEYGALDTRLPTAEERDRRYHRVLSAVRQLDGGTS